MSLSACIALTIVAVTFVGQALPIAALRLAVDTAALQLL